MWLLKLIIGKSLVIYVRIVLEKGRNGGENGIGFVKNESWICRVID